MKRSVLLIALLLSVGFVHATPKDYGIISTLDGKAFFDCRIMHVYPDGVSFTHRDGAAKIAFKDLPYNLRNEFHYDAKADAEYQKAQAALRKAEQERQKQQEIVMQERLMAAKMAEASYLAEAKRLANTPAPMSLAQPGEQVNQTTPGWVGTPITGPAVGGRGYSNGSYSGYGYPYGYYGSGYGYPVGGSYYGVSYGAPYYGGYSYGGYPYYGGSSYGSYPYYGGSYGGGYGLSGFGQWNVGHGIHIGFGGGSFGHHHR